MPWPAVVLDLLSHQRVLLRVPLRECWMIYKGPGFLAVIWFGSSPPPSPSLPSASCLPVCRYGRAYWRVGGGGEPNLMTARKPGHLQIIQVFLVPLLVKRNCLTYVKLNNTIWGKTRQQCIRENTDKQVYRSSICHGTENWSTALRPVTKGKLNRIYWSLLCRINTTVILWPLLNLGRQYL